MCFTAVTWSYGLFLFSTSGACQQSGDVWGEFFSPAVESGFLESQQQQKDTTGCKSRNCCHSSDSQNSRIHITTGLYPDWLHLIGFLYSNQFAVVEPTPTGLLRLWGVGMFGAASKPSSSTSVLWHFKFYLSILSLNFMLRPHYSPEGDGVFFTPHHYFDSYTNYFSN